MHEWIRSAFSAMNVPTELAASCLRAGAGQCFAGYEKFDLLWQGRKIAGAAQRRRRDGLLIQGSVQPPPLTLSRAEWQKAMREAARSSYGAEWKQLKPDPLLRQRADELARQKYSQKAFNERR
jgi:lipoate-protein ligase A